MSSVKRPKNLKRLCRVCLSQGNKMLFLNNPLNEETGISILEVLEMVMHTKVELDTKYPCVICPDCLKLANLVYDFKQKFENSQEVLQKCFSNYKQQKMIENGVEYKLSGSLLNDPLENQESLSDSSECGNNEDVEVIYINDTDSQEDLDIECVEVEGWDGATVENFETANIVSHEAKMFVEHKDTKPLSSVNSKQKRKINVDQYIIELEKTNVVNVDIETLRNTDEELIQAALNLKYKCSVCPKFYSTKRRLEKHKEGCKKLKGAMNYKKPRRENEDSLLFESDMYSSLDSDGESRYH